MALFMPACVLAFVVQPSVQRSVSSIAPLEVKQTPSPAQARIDTARARSMTLPVSSALPVAHVSFLETALLSAQHIKLLSQWYGAEAEWRLCYRASRDGFPAKKFHELCDHKGETMVIIR